ncbi:MAG: VPDSG-CTERM sorting domain-containing protein [Limisphaerales bacterium]
MKSQIVNVLFVLGVFALLTQNVSAFPARTPDAGSTAALTGIAAVGLAVVRRFIRR